MSPSVTIRRLIAATVLAAIAACTPGLPGHLQGIVTPTKHAVPFKAEGDYLRVFDGTSYRPLFIKGMNLGLGTPGTTAGELALSTDQYTRWLERMSQLGVNTLRVYTLHFPRFYEALAVHNGRHPEKPIYLLHGIWLDEEERHHDLYSLTESFDQSIRDVVDAVHGKGNIMPRHGRGHGAYFVDVSPWVMGYIIGREIHGYEVKETNRAHPDRTSYQGQMLSMASGNPSEVWLAERLDTVISYEQNTYGVQRPVSASSWPTIDPITHPTENPHQSQEDIAQIDLTGLDATRASAGFFASYHAYPYYPDFINDDPGYRSTTDHQGPNSYLGYLKDLKRHYAKVPFVVAEFGVPSSWGNAHYAHSGMDHGGHDEAEQGQMAGRMLQNIYDAKAAGGIWFAWMDEWWKSTWIVDPLQFPRESTPFWHNVTSPEENFGLIAFDLGLPAFQTLQEGSGRVQKVDVAADAEFFHARLTLGSALNEGESLSIGFDTYRNDLGESQLPGGETTSRRHEFALVLQAPKEAQLYVTEAYDLFRIWDEQRPEPKAYQSTATDGAPWHELTWKNTREHSSLDGSLVAAEKTFPIGRLRVKGPLDSDSSMDAVRLSGNTVTIRLPWSMLQVVDPTQRHVMHDEPQTPERESAISEGIALSIWLLGEQLETPRYAWSFWHDAPATREREKPSMALFGEALKALPDFL